MSYSGSTAASSVANPPSRVATGLLSQRNIRESTSVAEGGSLWTYVSSNLTTDIVSSGFFTDAGNLGMRNGDIMIAGQYSTEGSSSYVVSIGMITFDSTSAASMSTEGTITSSGGH
jgi:hypothetical protein